MSEPTFRSVDHVALTVLDPARSGRFYADVLGFDVAVEQEDGVLCVHQRTGFTIGFFRAGETDARFDHRRVGLDHLGLVAASRAELDAWAVRLETLGVEYTPVADEPLGSHLNFRDPDGIALELFAPSELYESVRAEIRDRPLAGAELRSRAQALLALGDPAETR